MSPPPAPPLRLATGVYAHGALIFPKRWPVTERKRSVEKRCEDEIHLEVLQTDWLDRWPHHGPAIGKE